MARLSPIEKLARDICWAEFTVRPKEITKASYWNDRVHADKKAEYVRDAEWLVFICQKLKPLRVLQVVDYPDRAGGHGDEQDQGQGRDQGGPLVPARLKSFIERAERVIEERKAVQGDLRDIFAEAQGVGYNPKIMRRIIAERARDAAELAAERDELDTYRHALGMAVELVRDGLSLRDAERKTGISKSSIHRASTVPESSQNAVPHDPSTGEIIEPQQTADGNPPRDGEGTLAASPAGVAVATSCTAGPEQGAEGSSPPPDDAPQADRTDEPTATSALAVGAGADTTQESCEGRGVEPQCHDNPAPHGLEPSEKGPTAPSNLAALPIEVGQHETGAGNAAMSELHPESAPRAAPSQDPITDVEERAARKLMGRDGITVEVKAAPGSLFDRLGQVLEHVAPGCVERNVSVGADDDLAIPAFLDRWAPA